MHKSISEPPHAQNDNIVLVSLKNPGVPHGACRACRPWDMKVNYSLFKVFPSATTDRQGVSQGVVFPQNTRVPLDLQWNI